MHCTLIYNPAAGLHGRKRAGQQVETIADGLRRHGHSVELLATAAAGDAGRLAAKSTGEIVFACGGDGTINEVLGGVLRRTEDVALGVLPMGTVNALARNLCLSNDPLTAALQQIDAGPCQVRVGVLQQPAGERPFLLVAGGGPDGLLARVVRADEKRRYGRLAYALVSLRLLLTTELPGFDIEFEEMNGERSELRAGAVLAVRVGSLQGFLAGIGDPMADPVAETLSIIAVKAPARRTIPLWLAGSWSGMEPTGWVATRRRVRWCRVPAGVPLEVDGEYMGHGPATFALGERTVAMRIPARARKNS